MIMCRGCRVPHENRYMLAQAPVLNRKGSLLNRFDESWQTPEAAFSRIAEEAEAETRSSLRRTRAGPTTGHAADAMPG